MKDVLETLERWVGEGLRFATATVVRTGSAPRDPGATLAVSGGRGGRLGHRRLRRARR